MSKILLLVLIAFGVLGVQKRWIAIDWIRIVNDSGLRIPGVELKPAKPLCPPR